MRRILFLWLVLVLMGAAHAQAPVENYLRKPQYRNPVLSPDGKHLAVLAPVDERMNLVTIDLATRKRGGRAGFNEFDVVGFRWVGNDWLAFWVGQFNTPIGDSFGAGGLYVMHRDGSGLRRITGIDQWRGLHYYRAIPGGGEEFLAVANERSREGLDLYRVNARTGRSTMLTFDYPPQPAQAWVVDRDLVPRVAYAIAERSYKTTVYFRPRKDAKWEILSESDDQGHGASEPLAIDRDERSLVVLARAGGDTAGLYRYDIAARKITETLAVHPRFDMGADSLRTDPDGSILGFQLEAERYQVAWTDASSARLQKTVDTALPGKVNKISRSPDARLTLVTSYSDREAERYYLLDEAKNSMEELFASRPWLKPGDLVEMRPFLLKTRDGLEIPSFFFLPQGRRADQRLPTVVLIHGGPEARSDVWGYGGYDVQDAQVLASRGYAVVLPNFRITPGLGIRIQRAGYGEVGRRMQEDHEDATRWAIDQGIADPARICIHGASYGGYAALMGVVKTPDLYRCSIAEFPVTDWDTFQDSVLAAFNYSRRSEAYRLTLLGDLSKDPATARAIAPARNADKIKAAVFLVYGGEDYIVPKSQPIEMASALKAAKKDFKLLVRHEEGHGFRKLENDVDRMNQVLDFLDTQIGAKAGVKAVEKAAPN